MFYGDFPRETSGKSSFHGSVVSASVAPMITAWVAQLGGEEKNPDTSSVKLKYLMEN